MLGAKRPFTSGARWPNRETFNRAAGCLCMFTPAKPLTEKNSRLLLLRCHKSAREKEKILKMSVYDASLCKTAEKCVCVCLLMGRG